VIDGSDGTAAKVRVQIESRDSKEIWTTVGVSKNIIEASWQELVDSVQYKLSKTLKGKNREETHMKQIGDRRSEANAADPQAKRDPRPMLNG